MAITSTDITSELIMVMDNGIGSSGQSLSKNRVYKNIKTAATDEEIFAVAAGLSNLQTHELQGVLRRNTIEIENEGV
jgi:hypothetical protein